MDAISATQLSKHYGTLRALQGVSFTVKKGEIIGLLGPNGAGKTTLMKILTGYLQPDEGSATIAGFDISSQREKAQEQIGYLPEHAPLYRDMTVQDYLIWMADLRQLPKDKRGAMLHEAVERTGLGAYLGKKIETLSKGYRQRVGLAQALVHRPALLILDEPTTGLDPNQIVEIRDVLVELAQSTTVLLSTHILPEVERVCQRVLLIAGGTLKADATLDELQSSESAWVKLKGDDQMIEETLSKAKGVTSFKLAGQADREGYRPYRVFGGDGALLCPEIFQALRSTNLDVAEIRPDSRNLESVFAELAAGQSIALRDEGVQ